MTLSHTTRLRNEWSYRYSLTQILVFLTLNSELSDPLISESRFLHTPKKKIHFLFFVPNSEKNWRKVIVWILPSPTKISFWTVVLLNIMQFPWIYRWSIFWCIYRPERKSEGGEHRNPPHTLVTVSSAEDPCVCFFLFFFFWTTDKGRDKENTYKWVSVLWKTKNSNLGPLSLLVCLCCLLWRNKTRDKQKTCKSVGVMKD